MKKHKVIKDFQLTTSDKKILTLKTGTHLEDYNYVTKTETIKIDKDLVVANPDYFISIDWRDELNTFLRSNKIPQPGQITKKLVPFIEYLLVNESVPVNNSEELDNRELKLKFKEEDIDIRLKRIEKRENEYKEDISLLNELESKSKSQLKDIQNRESKIKEKDQELNIKERNIDKLVFESSKDVESKYSELKEKIEKDMNDLTARESEFNQKFKEKNQIIQGLEERESKLDDREKEYKCKYEELKAFQEDLNRINDEINTWEGKHWKMKRWNMPPSAITE